MYELQYGGDVPPGPIGKQGHRLIRSADEFRVINDPYIAWTVPADLGNVLRSVRSGELEYVGSVSSGLLLHDSHGKPHVLGESGSHPAVSVIREGRLAVSLRFEFDEILPQIHCAMDLTFPVFKSWVEVDWRIDDPRGEVAGAEFRINMNLETPTRQAPTLVDFGTPGFVYLPLGPAQEGVLHGGSGPWEVLRGPAGKLEPFVTGPSQRGPHAAPEGWAHVMDRRRCLALAVHQFGMEADDHLTVSAEGRVDLRRSFPPTRPSTAKRLRFWLHFIPFPPQETAATSPQAMQNPVVVRVRAADPSNSSR